MTDPATPAEHEGRLIVADLLQRVRHAALGTVTAEGHPMVTRAAVLWTGAHVLTLVSDLSAHTGPLLQDGRASVLIDGPPEKGDPMNQPRLTLQGTAKETSKAAERDSWLAAHPKSKLYFDFGDFRMIAIKPVSAALNGGFGKAYALRPSDLSSATSQSG